MDKVRFTAHITFIKRFHKNVPWHVYFVDVDRPNIKYIITLDSRRLNFYHDDIYFNKYVEDFPINMLCRDETNKHYVTNAKWFEMEECILNIYETKLKVWNGLWLVPIGAVDIETHNYLKNILPYVVLLPRRILSEAWAEMTAREIQKKAAHLLFEPMTKVHYTVHISFVLHYSELVPWHIYFVDTREPERKIIVTLNSKYVSFSICDLFHNCRVDDFPRKKIRVQNGVNCTSAIRTNIKRHILDIYMHQLKCYDDNRYDVIIGATNKMTYEYLKQIIPNKVVQLPRKIPSEVLSVYAAMKIQERWEELV